MERLVLARAVDPHDRCTSRGEDVGRGLVLGELPAVDRRVAGTRQAAVGQLARFGLPHRVLHDHDVGIERRDRLGPLVGPAGARVGRHADTTERRLELEGAAERARRDRVVLDDGAARLHGPQLEPAPERLPHGVADDQHPQRPRERDRTVQRCRWRRRVPLGALADQRRAVQRGGGQRARVRAHGREHDVGRGQRRRDEQQGGDEGRDGGRDRDQRGDEAAAVEPGWEPAGQHRTFEEHERRDRDRERDRDTHREEGSRGETGAVRRQPQEDRPVVQVHAVRDEAERGERPPRQHACERPADSRGADDRRRAQRVHREAAVVEPTGGLWDGRPPPHHQRERDERRRRSRAYERAARPRASE